jgi:hypothetical protein
VSEGSATTPERVGRGTRGCDDVFGIAKHVKVHVDGSDCPAGAVATELRLSGMSTYTQFRLGGFLK